MRRLPALLGPPVLAAVLVLAGTGVAWSAVLLFHVGDAELVTVTGP